MTDAFRNMLAVLKYSIFGNGEPQKKQNVCSSAKQQGVLPLVYPFSDEKEYEKIFLIQLAKNEQRIYSLKQVLKAFEKHGIECCVLKGYSIAVLYHMPEYRISGDVDLLIEPKNEGAAEKILREEFNMSITPRSADGHHFKAQHPSGGLFEIHTALYGSEFDNLVLEGRLGESGKWVTVTDSTGFSFKTLNIRDNLYFLTAHLIKHFIKEGCGIRQITDLLVYLNRYWKEIDTDEYFKILRQIRFEKFVKNVLGIGVKYFGLSFQEYETEFSQVLLEDIETGGCFGFSDTERAGFFDNFILHQKKSDGLRLRASMSIKRSREILRGVFLPKRQFLIKKGYIYLEKRPYMYPLAYIARIKDAVGLMVAGRRSIDAFGFNPKENNTVAERLKLMDKLEIFGGDKK